MKRRDYLKAVGAGSTPLLAGCTGGGDGAGEATPTSTATPTTTATTADDDQMEVTMIDTTYDPLEAAVEPGTTVVWANADSFGHDVASAQFSDSAASWDLQTKILQQGEAASYTFEEPGVYEYYCTIHSRQIMCGVVVVGDVSYDGSLPCA
jgi:plastocyanin